MFGEAMSTCPASEGKSGSWSTRGGTVPGNAAVRRNAPKTKNSRLRKANGVTHQAVESLTVSQGSIQASRYRRQAWPAAGSSQTSRRLGVVDEKDASGAV